MDCLTMNATDSEFFKGFRSRVALNRIPLTGGMELTTRCNFACVHCYQPENRRKDTNGDMDTDKALAFIDSFADEGCLFLLLTGGEPLLHRDFSRIYTHAVEKGILVTVFTNGSTLTGEHIHLFKTYPPTEVEISLYGSTKETYRNITGSASAFDRAMKGINALRENGIRIKLKTVLMNDNLAELKDMMLLAERFGADFRFDPALMPRLDGDLHPITRRVSPEEAVKWEFADENKAGKWVAFREKTDPAVLTNPLYLCGAGRTCFHITSNGFLQPCLLADDLKQDLGKKSFRECWALIGDQIAKVMACDHHPCKGCDLISLCGYCPPFFRLETGSDQKKSDYICRMGHFRHDQIMKTMKNRLDNDEQRHEKEQAHVQQAPVEVHPSGRR